MQSHPQWINMRFEKGEQGLKAKDVDAVKAPVSARTSTG
jgi:hypothetical protein